MHRNRRSIFCCRFKAPLLYRLDGLPIQSIPGWLLHTHVLWNSLRVDDKSDLANRLLEGLAMFLRHLSHLVWEPRITGLDRLGWFDASIDLVRAVPRLLRLGFRRTRHRLVLFRQMGRIFVDDLSDIRFVLRGWRRNCCLLRQSACCCKRSQREHLYDCSHRAPFSHQPGVATTLARVSN